MAANFSNLINLMISQTDAEEARDAAIWARLCEQNAPGTYYVYLSSRSARGCIKVFLTHDERFTAGSENGVRFSTANAACVMADKHGAKVFVVRK